MSTELRDRLGGLAAAATDGIELRRPDLEGTSSSLPSRRRLVLVVAVFLAVLAGAAWFAARESDEVGTIDGGPTSATWPDPPPPAAGPVNLPRLTFTAAGLTATTALEQRSDAGTTTSVDPLAAYRPAYGQVFRRVGDPWSLITVSRLGASDFSTECTGSPLDAAKVTDVCDFSGDETSFEVEADGVVARVQGLGVSAAEIRRFVDELGGDAMFTPPAVCCATPPTGFEVVGGGPLVPPIDNASILYEGDGRKRVTLYLMSGTSVLAYGELAYEAAAAHEGEVSIHELGDRVVAMFGPDHGRDAFWMEGAHVAAMLHAEGLTADETLDLISSIHEDPAMWDRLLAGG